MHHVIQRTTDGKRYPVRSKEHEALFVTGQSSATTVDAEDGHVLESRTQHAEPMPPCVPRESLLAKALPCPMTWIGHIEDAPKQAWSK